MNDISFTWQNRFSLKKAICIFANIFFQFSTTFKRLSDFMTRAVDIFFFQLRKKMSSTLTQKVISSWKQDFQDVLDPLWIFFGPNMKLLGDGLFASSSFYNPSFLKILEVIIVIKQTWKINQISITAIGFIFLYKYWKKIHIQHPNFSSWLLWHWQSSIYCIFENLEFVQ